MPVQRRGGDIGYGDAAAGHPGNGRGATVTLVTLAPGPPGPLLFAAPRPLTSPQDISATVIGRSLHACSAWEVAGSVPGGLRREGLAGVLGTLEQACFAAGNTHTTCG